MDHVQDLLFIVLTLLSFAALALLAGVIDRRLTDDRQTDR